MKLKDFLRRGETSKLAQKLGISEPVVSTWSTGRRKVPAARCPDIERYTGGAVTCEDLRPDVDWSYLRSTAKRPPVSEGCP
ncbi:MAG: helix-turn-helix domain-containing protein [Azoarcus sp.]|nr:helix-turn-helix domain-containing protein [Azoarcus sp.]